MTDFKDPIIDPFVDAVARAISTTAQPLNEAFTRQHYEAIAEVMEGLLDNVCELGGADEDAIGAHFKKAVGVLATLFQNDNRQFDRNRFMRACGV